MTAKRMLDGESTAACLAHIRAASRLCEDAGLLTEWATLMGVADDIVAMADLRIRDRD